MEGPGTAVRVTPSRPQADEWAVVLAAAGIPHWMRERLDGWALLVPPDDAATAVNTLAAYDRENDREPENDDADDEGAPVRPPTIAGAVVALLLVGFFAITGPRAAGSVWFERGSADAARLMAGEWWRSITALTLHADVPHVLGNALATVILVTAVCWNLGPGVGLWLVLLAGAGGNALTAVAHRTDHISVGASTATFGALGILATLRIVVGRTGLARRKWWIVVAASLALLALLGTGPHADILAHLFGFLVGGGLGLIGALSLRRPVPTLVQWLLIVAFAATLLVAWRVAL
jgi:membrane associated rhomboid family serine protease